MKVYGALLWSLGKVIDTPEVTRVYVGSFWSEPIKNPDTKELLEVEMSDLFTDLANLPRMGAVRKINDIVKRMRKIRCHAAILDHLRMSMPSVFGKDKKKKELLSDLPSVFRAVMKQYEIPVGDFPDLEKFKRDLAPMDFMSLPKIKGKRMGHGKRMKALDEALNVKIPEMLYKIPGMKREGM